MNKLFKIFKVLQPALEKKVPMFNQTVKQFSTSKSNFIGGLMIAVGVYMLYNNPNSELGIMIAGNGIGLITLKDATTK